MAPLPHPLPALVVRGRRLASPLAFAPLSGVSNLPARLLAREAGAGIVFTETVNARALVEGRPAALAKLRTDPAEGPLAVQVFGGESRFLAEAAARLADRGVPWVDLNLGCPVKKFLRAGAGSALLREPERLPAIFTALRRAFPGVLSVKLRLGWDHRRIVAPDVARMARDAGVDLVTVHGRTRAQQYRGHADRAAIAAVVAAVPELPVLANGDVRTPDDVFAMRAETGAAGVMIGRGAVGNPWIFARTLAAAAGRPAPTPSRAIRLETLERHLEWIARVSADAEARVHQVRRYVAAYSKGLPGSVRFREAALAQPDADRVVALARAFLGPRPDAEAA